MFGVAIPVCLSIATVCMVLLVRVALFTTPATIYAGTLCALLYNSLQHVGLDSYCMHFVVCTVPVAPHCAILVGLHVSMVG